MEDLGAAVRTVGRTEVVCGPARVRVTRPVRPEAPRGVEKIVTSAPLAELRNMKPGAYIAVMTHSHDLDYDLVLQSFKRGGFAYLGLIGSLTKRATFEKRLLADGVTKDQLAQLRCPIGLGGTGKHPREIAISIAAELLTLGITRMGEEAAA